MLIPSSPDLIAPTIAVTYPLTGNNISGTVTMTCTVADDHGIAGVQWKVDGVNYGSEMTSAPYSKSLDTLPYSDAGHTISAVVRDVVGHLTVSATQTPTFNNLPAGGQISDGDYSSGQRLDLPTYPGNTWNNGHSFSPGAPAGYPTYYKRQVQLFVGTAEQNADGGTHVIELSIGGTVICSASAFNGTGFGITSAWTDCSLTGAITMRRYRNGGTTENAKTLDVRVNYRYVRL